MRLLKDIPNPIVWNIFSVFLIGLGCLIVGMTFFITTGDKIMLFLSLALFSASMLNAGNVLYIGIYRKYNEITGTCTAIKHQMFKRKSETLFVDDDYKEFTLYLHNKYKLLVGITYVFYFRDHSISEQLDINLLGFEKERSEH